MGYISSDINVWLDLEVINRLALPFQLPYTYLMNQDVIEDELLSPSILKTALIDFGLVAVELTTEEFYLAEEYNAKYTKPSVYDCIALAIAKVRGIILMSGDGPLRKAAKQENVKVIGTIGVLDKLYDEKYIDETEYRYCISELLKNNGGKVRLPEVELKTRLNK